MYRNLAKQLQSSNSLKYTVLISCSLAFVLLSTFKASADNLIPKPDAEPFLSCDQKEGMGSVFFEFKNLYIVYPYYPSFAEQSQPDFPDVLKFEQLNANLVNAIKRNFQSCLQLKDGKNIPIIIIPPHNISSNDKLVDKALNSDIHLPENLSIIINMNYLPGHKMTIGQKEYGHLSFFIYRPEASHKLSRLPLAGNSRVLTFFPEDTENLENILTTFFKSIRPSKTSPTPTEENDVHPF